jgi:hypothetical protein
VEVPSAFSKELGEEEKGIGQGEIDAAVRRPWRPRTASELILGGKVGWLGFGKNGFGEKGLN